MYAWYIAILLIVLLFYGFRAKMTEILDNNTHSIKLKYVNQQWEFHLDFNEILDHDILKDYLSSIGMDEELTVRKLKSNANALVKEKKISDSVVINIKGWDVYIDWKISFTNVISHPIFIPYEMNEYEARLGSSYGVTIWIAMSNWSIKIQIWDFDPADFNTISIHEHDWKIYRLRYDVVDIPIMFLDRSIFLDKTHFNITPTGIEGYYAVGWRWDSKEWVGKYKAFEKKVDTYYEAQIFNDETAFEMLEPFRKEAEEYLKAQGIVINDYEWSYETPWLTRYDSKYLKLRTTDWNWWYKHAWKQSPSWIVEEKFRA